MADSLLAGSLKIRKILYFGFIFETFDVKFCKFSPRTQTFSANVFSELAGIVTAFWSNELFSASFVYSIFQIENLHYLI